MGFARDQVRWHQVSRRNCTESRVPGPIRASISIAFSGKAGELRAPRSSCGRGVAQHSRQHIPVALTHRDWADSTVQMWHRTGVHNLRRLGKARPQAGGVGGGRRPSDNPQGGASARCRMDAPRLARARTRSQRTQQRSRPDRDRRRAWNAAEILRPSARNSGRRGATLFR